MKILKQCLSRHLRLFLLGMWSILVANIIGLKRNRFLEKILVPRPRKQAGELSQLLENYGADVLEVPFIDIQEDYNRDSITNVFTDITSYEWIVFTSSMGWIYF